MAIDTTVPELESLQKSASSFRDLVNESRLHHSLFQQRTKFNLVCSAMDIIDDILFALNSYTRNNHSDQGLAYLEIFGVLQALSVQQDAISKLYKIITGSSIDLENAHPDLKIVRDTRIRVAGHPVGGQSSSHFLVRYTVSKWGFELWRFDQAGNQTTEHVNLLELIKKNSLSLDSAMRDLIQVIETEERRHKEKFLGKCLADDFKLISYFSSKMTEAIPRRDPMGLVGLSSNREVLARFRAGLAERGEHFQNAGFVSDDIPKLEYAMGKFENYVRGDETQNEKDAYILASFIYAELKHLKQIAEEIDAEYKIDPPESVDGPT